MLRGFVLLMVLLNAGYFAWSQGYFSAYGLGPAELSEPQRMAQQIRPNDLRILSTDMAARLEEPPAAAAVVAPAPVTAPVAASVANPASCLQVGPFDASQAVTLGRALDKALPAESWQLEPAVLPAHWIIYMGKYESTEAVARKKAELRSLNVLTEPLHNSSLEPGVSLGGFDSHAAANASLAKLAQRGVRTARVVQDRAETRGKMLRLPQADDSLRSLLDAAKPALLGKPVLSCPPAIAAQAASANAQPGRQSER